MRGNGLRTLAYLRAWADRYKDHGLVVIGVHTPEFDVEHDLDNVRRAAKDLRVTYPMAIDNDYAIWNAVGHRYWTWFRSMPPVLKPPPTGTACGPRRTTSVMSAPRTSRPPMVRF
jgi:hypothetical protein